MMRSFRIGTQIWPDDPFWVQVREAIEQSARKCNADLIMIVMENASQQSAEEELTFVEEVLAQDVDALISWDLYERSTQLILESGLPIIYLSETHFRHPRFVSPFGLRDTAIIAGEYLAEQLGHRGSVLAVGGLCATGEDGRSRLAGMRAVIESYSEMCLQHIPSLWRYELAFPQILAGMRALDRPIDAIFGLSDSLALAARDAGRELGLVDSNTLIVGINGDPLALAAIFDGSMAATVRTSAADLGRQAIELALRAAQGFDLPIHFSYQPTLVTTDNVAEVAIQQLIAMASLPNRLVGYSRRQEQQRMVQLETSLEINRRAGLILDRQRLSYAIAELIRANYRYDEAHLVRWDAETRQFTLEQPDRPPHQRRAMHIDESPVLGAAIEQNQPIFIPDTRHSHRFAPDPTCTDVQSRVAIPIRVGSEIAGLLDLRSYHSTHHSHHELVGLQTLADQLGIAIRNAELYDEAVHAQARAEKADELKTRLLANVSHELRTPLNVILGYSQAVLESANLHDQQALPQVRRDMEHIYRSAEHLIRLINDLLDLSRAEIDELELFPEPITPHVFLQQVFHTVADQAANDQVSWQMDIPARLPIIQADPVRLRQILLNLLHNAQKFTSSGEIVLGAEVMLPYLHIWVADTGQGIPAELQARMFEPFVTGHDHRPHQGIGLGLSITRWLVTLHRGTMTLESQPKQGSTFHVYLPLPRLTGAPVKFVPNGQAALLLITASGVADDKITDFCQQQGLVLRCLRHGTDFESLLSDIKPVALAWNIGNANRGDVAIFEQIRGQPHLAQLPLLFISDYQGRDVSGITNIVLKPLHGEKLLEVVDRLQPQAVGGSILIVDDDPEAHAVYRRLIAAKQAGYTFRDALDGREARAILEHELPCLIILDLMMPHLDGFDLLQQIRATPRTRHIPVLVLSGHVLSFEDIQRLNHAHVTFHSKGVLTDGEIADAVERTVQQADRLPPPTSVLVKHALAYMQQNYADTLSLQEIADAVGVNKDYLGRIFHRELGISPWEYLNRYRISRAKELLRATSTSISAIAYEVGFQDAAYFSRVFHKEVGCAPREYREHP